MQAQVQQTKTWGKLGRKAAVAALGAMVGVSALGAAPAAAAPTPACAQSAVPAAESSAQDSFVAKLNSLRSSKGLGSLAVNTRITGPSVSWSETMSAQDWLHHARDTGADDGVEPSQDYVTLVTNVVPNWRRVGENVGVSGMWSWCSQAELDSSTQRAVNSLHTAFVNSEGHYRNMVGDFNQVGIGVHIDSDELWVTVRFAKGDLPQNATVDSASGKYIDSLHRLFLKRSATSAEKQRWASAVQSGNRAALANALAVSNEWAGVRINDLYKTVLGRDADASGRAYWVNQVASGVRLEDAAAGFYAGPEYFNRKGGTNRAFIEGLYKDILGRTADTGGRDYWVLKLHTGKIDRLAAAASFYASIESRRDRVTTLYREVLGRGTDTAGREYWAGQLLNMGDIVLATQLASSPEFYSRSTR